jgi:hypothetical protein
MFSLTMDELGSIEEQLRGISPEISANSILDSSDNNSIISNVDKQL